MTLFHHSLGWATGDFNAGGPLEASFPWMSSLAEDDKFIGSLLLLEHYKAIKKPTRSTLYFTSIPLTLRSAKLHGMATSEDMVDIVTVDTQGEMCVADCIGCVRFANCANL